MNMAYQWIVLDIDGTLTNSRKEIPPRTKQALLFLQSRGVGVILASGRPTFGVEPIARQLELKRWGGYILSYNGGKITECATGKTVFRKELPAGAAVQLAALKQRLGTELLSYEGTCVITENPEDPYVQKEAAINKMEIRKISSFADYVTFPVTKCLMVGEGNYLGQIEPLVAAELGEAFSVYRSEPYFLEIMPRGIDKAQSLSWLLEKLGKTRENLLAFGDGYNDCTMLRYAGLGVAMGNAGEAAKAAADRITDTNDREGVALMLEEVFPGCTEGKMLSEEPCIP